MFWAVFTRHGAHRNENPFARCQVTECEDESRGAGYAELSPRNAPFNEREGVARVGQQADLREFATALARGVFGESWINGQQ